MNNLKNLNSRIKGYRKSLGLTQQQFADALNMKRSNYAHLESEGNPSPDTLLKLSAILKISVDELLGNPRLQSNADIQKIAADMMPAAVHSPNAFDGDIDDDVLDTIISPPDAFVNLDPVEREIIVNYRIMNETNRKKVRNLIMKIRNPK
ncbi:MAG: helix-turn-helix transcriptional regulator [Clostridia bacterium]|nr:helix-turn-helix transcriptional regulator [Clostridia bacterium]